MNRESVNGRLGLEWKSEAGQTLPLLGLVIVMAAIAATMVIDFGLLYASRAKAHAVADLAALAAVQDLPSNPGDVEADAREWAKRNGFEHNPPSVIVTVENVGVPCAHLNACVSVEITREFKWTFGWLLGPGTASATSSAIAEKPPRKRDIVLVLDRSGSLAPISWGSYRPELVRFGDSASLSPGAEDHLALVTFPQDDGGNPCHGSCLTLDLTGNFGQPGSDAFDAALEVLRHMGPSNSNPLAAMAAAYGEVTYRPGAERSIVLLTDGDFRFKFGQQHEQEDQFDALIDSIAADGIRVDVIAIGDKSKFRAGLQSIASRTQGRYFPVHTTNDVDAQLDVVAGASTIAVTQ